MMNISENLIEWYSYNKRDLPWRDTKNPYNVWVSEIILQQTRVNQGLDYYYKFIERFPDIKALSKAKIEELLKVWQGLGYYSRARNMHHTAQIITSEYKGKFPSSYDELLKFKGIGDYTASAIASISFNEQTPVLDGNVFRVIARLFGISESTQTNKGKKKFKQKLYELIPKEDPGSFNQAIMEFGALQCIPSNPDCKTCLFNTICFAYNNNLVSDLPLKKQKVKQQIRYFNYLYITYKKQTFMEQRTNNDIWKLLYQLPLIETNKKLTILELEQTNEWKDIFQGTKPEIDIDFIEKKHILSHQKLNTTFYRVKINKTNSYLLKKYMKIDIEQLSTLGIPKLIENYFKEINK